MTDRGWKKRAISTVLTTLIIVVASVVLAAGVVLYSTSLFQTGAQTQSIATTGTKVWVDTNQTSGWSWGAADVRNSGDKLLAVDNILVRGTTIPFSNWYYDTNATQVTTGNFQSTLLYTSILNPSTGALVNGTGAGYPLVGGSCVYGSGTLQMQLSSGNPTLCLIQTGGPISLPPGAKAVIYFKIPHNVLTSVDAGTSGNVAIYAGQVGSPSTTTIASK